MNRGGGGGGRSNTPGASNSSATSGGGPASSIEARVRALSVRIDLENGLMVNEYVMIDDVNEGLGQWSAAVAPFLTHIL